MGNFIALEYNAERKRGMAFAPTKKEQLRMTCISFALELAAKKPEITDYGRNNSGYRSTEEIIKDAEKIYEWITNVKPYGEVH